MDLQNLFKLVRKGDVAIWVGAGFSMYAGYPSGEKLKKIIYSELATHSHDLLSRISHFKEIITTNYDCLIENSYTNRANVIRSDNDVPYFQNLKPSIYKAHGDIHCIEKIIITKNDYAKFYNIQRDKPFWVSILDILTKRNLLFLGYSFEDENIWSWFDLIDNAIETHRKERFLVAPGWTPLKIKQLQDKSITYIDLDAEAFLVKLDQEIKLNLAADLENGLVSQDTFNQYVLLNEYNSTISTTNGKPKLDSITKSGEAVVNKLIFATTDKKLARQMDQFTQGFGKSIKIPKKHLVKFEHFVGDFKMNISAETIEYFSLQRLPRKHKGTFELPDDGLIIEDIEFDSYQLSKNEAQIESNIWGFKLDVKIHFKGDGSTVTFHINNPLVFPSINKCVLFQKALLSFASKGKAVFFKDGLPHNIDGKIATVKLSEFTELLDFFEGLKKIEATFNIRFEGSNADFSEAKIQLVKAISQLIDHKYIEISSANGVIVELKDESENAKLKELPSHVKSVLIKSGENKIIDLFGHKIDLGEEGLQINDIDSFIMNKGKTTGVIKSNSGLYWQRYSLFFPFDSINDID
ncbi:MAG TPA: SIR2 family protein [Mucilaginibacter sp.]|nr:SIR2 family protein [Mucilaginibacter sp.]